MFKSSTTPTNIYDSPDLRPTPIAAYDVPYERANSPALLSPISTPQTPSNKYSLLYSAHRELQMKYDQLRAENEVLSQRLQVQMVIPSKDTNNNNINEENNDFTANITMDHLVNDVIKFSRELYTQRIWEDVEIIRQSSDYVDDYFCFHIDNETGVCKAGSFVICADYVCFVYNETQHKSLVLPLSTVTRVSVSILPLYSEIDSLTAYNWESTLCMDIEVKDEHYQFFGFDDIEAVILSLQGPDGKKVSSVVRQWITENENNNSTSPSTTRVPKDHREMYRLEIVEVERQLWSRLSQSSNWPIVYDKQDVRISSITPKDEPILYCVTAIIDALPREVWSAYYDLEQRKQWDNILQDSSRVIDQIDARTDVLYSCVSSALKGLISARDYIDIRRWIPQPDGQSIIVVYRGVAWYPLLSEKEAKADNRVRGQNHTCGALFEPIVRENRATPSCKMTLIVQTQANGWLPQNIVDKATIKWLASLPSQLREYFRSNDLS